MTRRGSGEAGRRECEYQDPRVRRVFVPVHLPAFPLWAALALLISVSHPAAAQTDRCVFQIDNVERQGSVIETAKGTNYFAGGNVRLSCRGSQITMQSDSVASYGGNTVQFIGNVKYRDS